MNLPDILSSEEGSPKSVDSELPEEEQSTEYHEVVYLGGEPGITTPYQESIVYKALEEMKRIDQEEIAKEEGIEDPRLVKSIKVEYEFSKNSDELDEVVKEFGEHVSQVSGDIAEQIMTREEERENTNPFERKEGYMTYIIEKSYVEDIGDIIVFGGANSIIFEMCDRLGFTSDDRRLIIKANEVAAKYSNLAHHTEVESVLFTPIEADDTELDSERIQDHSHDGEKEDVIR